MNVKMVSTILAVALVACKGPEGPAGPAGPQGDPGDPAFAAPTLSGANPHLAYTERSAIVTLSGSATNFDATTTVDFGAGITVDAHTVASATAIVAYITIGADAAIGPRDITVTTGDEAVTLSSGFIVQDPISLDEIAGTEAQGSIFLASIELEDMSTPLPSNPLTELGYLGYFEGTIESSLGGVSGMDFGGGSHFDLSILGYIDVFAGTGEGDLTIVDPDGETRWTAGDALEVAARTPAAIVAATPAAGTLAAAYESALLEYNPGEHPQLVTVNFEITTDDGDAFAWMLPESGSFQDTIALLQDGDGGQVFANGSQYFVVADPFGSVGAGYEITVTVDEEFTSAGTENDAGNGTCGVGADLLSVPGVITDASLSSTEDVDWYKIVLATDMAIDLTTFPGDEFTDTVISVWADDCSDMIDESADLDFQETLTGVELPAGTYYVQVAYSSLPVGASVAGAYHLVVTGEEIELPNIYDDEEDSNDECSTATEVELEAVVAGEVDSASDEDWYEFTLTETHDVMIRTEVDYPDVDVVIDLYDNCGEFLDFADGTSSDTLYMSLDAGTYQAVIYPYASNSYGEYDLEIRYDD